MCRAAIVLRARHSCAPRRLACPLWVWTVRRADADRCPDDAPSAFCCALSCLLPLYASLACPHCAHLHAALPHPAVRRWQVCCECRAGGCHGRLPAGPDLEVLAEHAPHQEAAVVSWAPRHVNTASSGGKAVGWCALPRDAGAGSSVRCACGLPGGYCMVPTHAWLPCAHVSQQRAAPCACHDPRGAGSSVAWAWHASPPSCWGSRSGCPCCCGSNRRGQSSVLFQRLNVQPSAPRPCVRRLLDSPCRAWAADRKRHLLAHSLLPDPRLRVRLV